MNERRIFIINKSTIAVVDKPRLTGGHGYEFTESPITFIGMQEPPPDAVNISMASMDQREEILDSYEQIFFPSRRAKEASLQDI